MAAISVGNEIARVLDMLSTGRPTAEPFQVDCHERLRQVIAAIPGNCSSSADLASLTRHVLLHAQATGFAEPKAIVRNLPGWPGDDMWRSFGFSAERTPAHTRLVARPWTPTWAPGTSDPCGAAFAGEQRRESISGGRVEPQIAAATGVSEFLSDAQRFGVRSALLLPAGETLLEVLPTGAGKTLVAEVVAAIGRKSARAAVIVVPTVALGVDLARRLARAAAKSGEALPPLAYHSGLSADERRAYRERMLQGTQPIVIAAPESLCRGLRIPLFRLAERGQLAWLIVDEAHLVVDWGQDFRPEFQLLPGLRRALLEQCPPASRFRTLLLTATATQRTYDTLDLLFGPRETGPSRPVSVLAWPALRHEATTIICTAPDEQTRIARVVETLRHAPRPALLYATLPRDVDSWFERLKELGHVRIAAIHGGTSPQDREEAIELWSRRQLDLVVATSAFGVGIDNRDVRTVLHACIPESIDRYYQEVGRAGRDGKAAVAGLFAAPRDRQVAREIASSTPISSELGLARWEAMADGSRQVGPAGRRRMLVPIDAQRVSSKHAPILRDSNWNEQWNIQTLVLMARAGLLEILAHAPPEIRQRDSETLDDFETRRDAALRDYFRHWAVKPLVDDHRAVERWRQDVAHVRSGEIGDGEATANEIIALVKNPESLTDALTRTYSYASKNILAGPWPNARLTIPSLPPPPIAEPFLASLGAADDDVFWVEYHQTNSEQGWRRTVRRIRDLLASAARAGFLEFLLPGDLATENWLDRLAASSSLGLVFLGESDNEGAPETLLLHGALLCGRVIVLGPHWSGRRCPHVSSGPPSRKQLVVFPSGTMDPSRPDRRCEETRGCIRLDNLVI